MKKTPVPSTTASPGAEKARTGLIFGAVGLFAAIVFGVLYLFVIAPAIPDGNIGWFLFSFATGLTMIVLPCTLPLAFVIVPLSMGKGMIRGIGMALAFGVGVATTLSLYGVAAALLGGIAIDALGADLDVIKNWVYFVAGSFALVFALSEIGLLNVRMPTYSGAAPAFIQRRGELIKAFLLGLFLGNVGVGCPHPATPLILIEIASSGDVLYGWLLFLIHAIGRILPLLLLAFLAILGVNGLNWLLARKDAVERTTGWAMVFVAGFILTLGLFSHDWWVNSGIHTGLESITQEQRFNVLINKTLGTEVEHLHGLQEGEGLFGLPLKWGNWFLVTVWLIPMWWWYRKRKRGLEEGSNACDERILSIKRNFLIVIAIFLILTFTYLLPKNFYLTSMSGGTGGDDVSALGIHAMLDGTVMDKHGKVLEGAHVMPDGTIMLKDGTTVGGADDPTDGIHAMPDGTIMDKHGQVLEGAHVMPDGTIMLADGTTVGGGSSNIPENATLYSTDISGLLSAREPELVELEDGDSYDIVAGYIKKEVGNRTLRMLAYNGSVPGPFIKAPQGAEITINFTNKTDFDQTIHSHGVRLDNNSDGVANVTQDPVKPGELYVYTIKFTDAGVYWYHPHVRDDYGQEMGLYGNYIIEPTNGYNTRVHREIPLIIDDILIVNDKIVDFYREFTNFALLGRFGNEYLVNGETDYSLEVQRGEVIRFFITDVSNVRTYNLSIPGAEMKVVGADVGQFEKEFFADDFLISPSERIIVEVYFENSGIYELTHTMPDGQVTLMRFEVGEDSVSESYENDFFTRYINENVIDTFASFRDYLDRKPDKRMLLTVELEGEVDHGAHVGNIEEGDEQAERLTGFEGIQWDDPTQSDLVNTTENVTWMLVDQETEKVSMDIDDWVFSQGDLVKIRITNDIEAEHVMQHPIHLHGQRFVVLSNNGVPNENMAWKDTVLVLPGEYIDILVEMSNLGEWMAHCHISEHLHAGMMMQFRVEDREGYATGDEYRASVQEDTVEQHNPVTFTYDFAPVDMQYSVNATPRFVKVGKNELIRLSFTDIQGSPVGLDDELEQVLKVTFVKSDDSLSFVTFPGNTEFPEAEHGDDEHDNSDAHHGFRLIQTAYAHGDDVSDGHHSGNVSRTYSVPVVFPTTGVYRGFVEFTLSGEDTERVASFDMEVNSALFSVDNFGWSKTTKWWILLTVSLLFMAPLVWGVRKYINVEKV